MQKLLKFRCSSIASCYLRSGPGIDPISLVRVPEFPGGIPSHHTVACHSYYNFEHMTSVPSAVKYPSPEYCHCAYRGDQSDLNLSRMTALFTVRMLIVPPAYAALEPLSPLNPVLVSDIATLLTGPGRALESAVRLVIFAVRTAVPEAPA